MSWELGCLLSSAVVLGSMFNVPTRNCVWMCNITLCELLVGIFSQFEAGQVVAELILLPCIYVCSELFESKGDGFVICWYNFFKLGFFTIEGTGKMAFSHKLFLKKQFL